MAWQTHHSSGFTLVELVMVILLLGVLSLGTVRFLTDASDGYAATVARTRLSASLRTALDKVSREVREALPNSLRVTADGACLEFVPVLQGAAYLDAPIGYSDDRMQLAPLDEAVIGSRRIAIAPLADVYALATVHPLSPAATFSGPDAANEVTAQFAGAHEFPRGSSQRRAFLVDQPVSFCLHANALWRYEAYGYQINQPLPVALPGGLPGRSLLVADVDTDESAFELLPASLSRMGSVRLALTLARAGDSLTTEVLVRVRNSP